MPLGISFKTKLLLPDKDGVPGVVAALIARDNVEMFGQQVDHVALALIAPLRTEDDNVLRQKQYFAWKSTARTRKTPCERANSYCISAEACSPRQASFSHERSLQ